MDIRSKYMVCFILALLPIVAIGQKDTVRLMHYNLLNYGDNVNPVAYKNSHLSTIIQHVQPDIFSANEIGNNSIFIQNIATGALGTDWEHGSFVNTGGQPQVNMLFWRKSLLGLRSQQSISSQLRDIMAYHLYYKDTITVPHDTVNLMIIVAHLKAGSDPSDSLKRIQETQTIVNYLNNLPAETNVLLAGDFNVYTATEQAYQNLISSNNNQSKFYDPINQTGDWHNNSSFAAYHTQSTRSVNLQDGGSSGGMDDRFDFILGNRYAMNDSAGVQYLANSYTTVGQDAQHFNKSINAAPQNTSAPSNVILALYEMSDHLPVYADFILNPATINTDIIDQTLPTKLVVYTHATTQTITINMSAPESDTYNISIYDMMGRRVLTNNHECTRGENVFSIPSKSLAQGVYLMQISNGRKTAYSRFLVH